MSLKDKLDKTIPENSATRKTIEPFWKGPLVDGVTQSMLHGYMACKERFRIRTIEGLAPAATFRSALEYGNLWHICEEHFAKNTSYAQELKLYAQELVKKYPTQSEDVNKYYLACLKQFPVYIDFWKKHPDMKVRLPVVQEYVFDFEYTLPSFRKVRLRGKLDSVDLVSKYLWIQENKTKSDLDVNKLTKQLGFDLQTMFYIFAVEHDPLLQRLTKSKKVTGIRYNCVRRPFSGGTGSIRQHKATKNQPAETQEEFYNRLEQIFIEQAETFFVRFNSIVTDQEKEEFNHKCLFPVLENLLDDYEWFSYCKENYLESVYDYTARERVFSHKQRHYVLPYGGYNPTAEGIISDIDEYMRTGNPIGLHRVETLFPELT